MKCFYCGNKMKRDEHIKITFFGIVNHPKKYKIGWKCPKCELIYFDEGVTL